MAESEVARLMRRIEEECEAAQRGLTGLAQGISQHAFITARMEHIERCREQLVLFVGNEEATMLVCKALESLLGHP